MTDVSEVADDVASDVVEEVDVGSALTGGDVTEGMDGESLGRSVGETIGETIGRFAGRALVDWILSKLTFWSDDDPSLSARFGRSLAVAVGRTLRKPEFKEPIGDALRGVVSSLEERQQAAKEAADEAAESAGDAAEGAQEAAEDAGDAAGDAAESAGDTAEDAANAATEGANAAAEKLASGDMDELRKETYRELLEMMEYSKLQSIAKESGVKANQQREDMIDAIVDNFDPDEAEGEESDGADDSSESDEGGDDESE